jgi:HK97 gp10 family phage protein
MGRNLRMSVTLEITSNRLPELLAGLDRTVAAAVTETALAVGIRAEALAPVSPKPYKSGGREVQPGRLKASVRVEPGASAHEALVKAGGGEVDYAPFVERGTRKAAAQPFMTPAAEGEEPQFVERLKEAVLGK